MSRKPDESVGADFSADLTLPSGDERASATGDASERAPLDSSAIDAALTQAGRVDTSELRPGARVGRFRLLEVLGRGGMGVVYRAEQENPRRTVALKLIRTDLPYSQLSDRFEVEAQILGRLQHPGIAQIYEAGTTDAGHGVQPYFAMEYVAGRPLTGYLQDARLSIPARLRLFTQICSAVQHAHTKGVIHRDLKPANILVVDESLPAADSAKPGRRASDPLPKILDFGVARVTDAEFEAHTLQTTIGQLIGTVPYMSPEQIGGDPRELDTRSDVYALGVILYEMLSGRLPYDLARRPLPEVARIIREVEPTPLPQTNRGLANDVDLICRTALEKDRARRYQSAAELAADVRRYLSDEPIAARPPSAWYQLRKFARRRRAVVIGLAATTLAIVGGLIATSAALARALRAESTAQREQREAEAARDSANEQRGIADTQRRRAEDESGIASAVNAFLNEMLASANPSGGDRDVTVREVLDRAAEKIEGGFPDQPRVEAELRHTIGRTYLGLGRPEDAARQFERAHALREQLFGPDGVATIESLNALATAHQFAGRPDQAEALFRRSLAVFEEVLGPQRPETLTIANNLGMLFIQLGRYADAEPLLRATFEGQCAAAGAESGPALDAQLNLATLLQYAGKLDESEALMRDNLQTRRRALGDLHPGTLIAVNNLGTLLDLRGKSAEAEPLYFESLELSRKVLGEEHPDTLISISNVAGLLSDAGKHAEAERLYREALGLQSRVLGENHADTLETRRNLSTTLAALNRGDEAEQEARAALAATRATLGPDAPDTADAEYALGSVLLTRGAAEEARQHAREATEIAERTLGPSVWKTAYYRSVYGEALLSLGEFDAAEKELLAARAVLAAQLRPDHPHTRYATESLIKLYERTDRPEKAAELRSEAAAEP